MTFPDAEFPALKLGLVTAGLDDRASIGKTLPSGAIVVESALESDVLSGSAVSRLRAAGPELLLVRSRDSESLLALVDLLHTEFPDAWVLAIGSASDPQVIIQAVRAGAREFLPEPLTRESLEAACQRYVEENPRRRREAGKIYAVTAAKGGAGATSVAINLAAATAKLPSTRVALVDLTYPLGDVAAYLSLKPKYTLGDALQAAQRLDPVLLATFMTEKAGTHILAGQARIEPFPSGARGAVAKLLSVLSDSFTHSVLDLSGAVSDEFLQSSAERASRILVVLTSEIPAIWRTHRLLNYLDSIGAGEKVDVVLNRSEKSSEILPKDIERTLNRPIRWQLPNNYRATVSSINAGLPSVEVDNSNLARSYSQLATSLTGISPVLRRKGLLGLFS